MNVQTLYDQGFQLRCEGAYREAREVLERVLASTPTHADAMWQLGLIQGFEGDFDGSIATLQKVVQSAPNHHQARYDLAMTYLMLAMNDEAFAEFSRLLTMSISNELRDKVNEQLKYF